MTTKLNLVAKTITLTSIILSTQNIYAQVDATICGDLSGVQWDYRTATQKQHIEVEGAHFPPIVENLIRGNRGYLGGDLAYTLRASPNHHRALASLMNWSDRLKLYILPNMPLPVECYFERGIRYKADDHVVRMLYAQFLAGKNRIIEVEKQLEQVASMAGDNAFTLYNIGLLYSDIKNYEKALQFAHQALALGFSKPELRQRLENAGQWKEPSVAEDKTKEKQLLDSVDTATNYSNTEKR